MSNKFLTRLSAVLIIVVLLLVYMIGCTKVKSSNKIDELNNLLTATQDTLKINKLKDGSQQATIQSLTTQNTGIFLDLHTKDSTIIELQTVVKQYQKQLKGGGSAIIVKGETNITSSGPTIIEHTSYDTIDKPVFPVYKSVINNKWYTIKSRADKDSTHVDLKIINSYDVVLGKEKGKWIANVINHNPYSSTKSMRAYNVEVSKTRQKRIGLAIIGGYGYNLQGEVRGTPFIGAGISYTILSLF